MTSQQVDIVFFRLDRERKRAGPYGLFSRPSTVLYGREGAIAGRSRPDADRVAGTLGIRLHRRTYRVAPAAYEINFKRR